MGKVTGFIEIERRDRGYRPAADRIRHYNEFVIPLDEASTRAQAARCMECGIPFCQNGCPVNNQIPDWNDLVYQDDWREALRNLQSTNNFPEFTGRICPAPCEASCTLNLTEEPVTIKTIECAIVDRGWQEGWIAPKPAARKTGKRVAIIGSGPAGLACAQQLARAGHDVHVYEKNAKPGGLLRYGIPDFKMEKHIIDRRVGQMEGEGVTFHCNVHVGVDKDIKSIHDEYDALILAGGSEKPRDLEVPGRELNGVHFAMDFLPQQNRRNSGEAEGGGEPILATGKRVVVIGGGDTGSDCIGTSIRQNALSVTQIEILPRPPEQEEKLLTWPNWPLKLRTSSSQEEGAIRDWSVQTTRVLGENGKVTGLECERIDAAFKPIEGTRFVIDADLVLLAMGFVHPVHEGMLESLGVTLDRRGNVAADTGNYRTSLDKVFACGDMRRGQSLVVWAIREGRQAARAVDEALMGESLLPR
ncbi:MAG TPA: glutamate synthase subunit beta [Hyphomicrobiales bacterium]|nr:glutamate synthase subunit beta [Rhodobiaceae bacterium]HXK53743.1 glutamate synthase subunit beta [Hyphomicrobiales bacterium]